jgi:deoxyribodipyrimidine photo-lyase
MTEEVSKEEIDDQKAVEAVCSEKGINFKLWRDDKYYIDDRDTGLSSPKELPDVFTTYRKTQEPLRERPRSPLPRPQAGSLPSFPSSWAPSQQSPFQIPESYEEFERRLLEPIDNMVPDPPAYPEDGKSAHPFEGGESPAWDRLYHLIKSGSMTAYQETRNGLLGTDYSTKLSAYLALGSISARSIHDELVKFEDGSDQSYAQARGFGQGENEGTKAMRFELLWRDYMRLCTMKFGSRLFKLDGFKGASGKYDKKWKTAWKKEADNDQVPSPEELSKIINRFLRGTTGMGLIDASQRELYHTGYTSNRARQNVASFFAKHLGIDWRYGAEWYEAMLVDYDVSSNWANWQYVAGVGNDPRGDARIFNPVKQAFDYDNNGAYVRTWVPEVKHIEKLENVFQVWTTNEEELAKYGIADDIMVTHPIKKIDFQVDRKPRGPRRPYRWRRGGTGRGGRRGGGGPGNGQANGSNDFNESRRSYHNSPPSPESDRQFYNGGDSQYMHHNGQSQGQPRNNWAPRGNQNTSWRGNSNGHSPNGHGPPPGRGGHMVPFHGNGFQRGYSTNVYNVPPPRQYMPNPSYPPQQFPHHAYHHQLPPHIGPHV